MTIWVKVMENLKRDYKNRPSNKLLSIIQTHYGYIGYLIGIDESSITREFLEKAGGGFIEFIF